MAPGLCFLGFLAAALLVLSARSFWLGEIAASFRWHLGWAGIAGALLLCLARSPRRAALLGLLSVWHVWPESALYFGGEEHGAHGPALTIASANVNWDNVDYDGFLSWLDREQPDVVAVLEITTEWRRILEGRRTQYPHMLLAPEPSKWTAASGGNILLSRLPFERTHLPFSEEARTRPSMEVVVRHDGNLLTLRAAHPPRPGKPWRIEARNAELRRLGGMAWGGTSILFGDLNVTSTSPVFADLLEATGLRDSRQGYGRLGSWNTDHYVPGLWLTIDHLLVGEDIAVLDRRTAPLPGSDHRIAVARIALRRR